MDWQIEDIIELFGDALDNYGERTMPLTFLEDFAKAQGFPEEDAARIVELIKEGSTQPEFPKFPDSTINWKNLGEKSVPDGHVSRGMFNFEGTQRFLTEKFPRAQGGIIDYKNLPVEEQNRYINNFYDGLNPSTTGSVEFYVSHQGAGKVNPGDIRYGRDVHQIPGFYTDPVGSRSLSQITGGGTNAPLTSYYKVQVDTNNLLIDIGPGKYAGTKGPLVGNSVGLRDQISKIDWQTFAKETGVSFDDLVEATKDMDFPHYIYVDGKPFTTLTTQGFSSSIKEKVRQITGVGDIDTIAALRKSGIEGFVTGPINVQYEIVFLDPNDDLGYGKRMNIDKVGVREFQANASKVKNIDSFAVIPFIDANAVDVPDDISTLDDESNRLAREAEEELTGDLADGDAMTEQSLSEIEDEIGPIDEEKLLDEIDDVGENSLTGIDPDVDIPDTIPDELVDEVDRDRLNEFLELAEPEGTVEFTAEEIAEQADLNAQSQLTPNESDEFANIVDNLNKQVDNLPVDKVVKKRFKTRLTRLGTQLLTPGGVLDFVDIYETAVLGLAMTIAAAPELKNMANTYAHNYWNNLGAAHGVAAYNQKEYEPDWERLNNIMGVVEKISPTDMLINKIMDAETDTQYVSAYLPTSIDNTNISEKLKGTLSFMREKPVNTKNEPDRLLETFIYGNTK